MSDPTERARPGFFMRLAQAFVGTADHAVLSNFHPAVTAFYRKDLPGEADFGGRHGADALLHEADRLGRRGSYTMQNVGYWADAAGQVVAGVTGLASSGASIGELATAGATARGTSSLSASIANDIDQASSQVVREIARTESSVGSTLGSFRDQAFRMTQTMEQELASKGVSWTPKEKGEFIDAVFKGLVRDGVEKGALPASIRVAPSPSAIASLPVPQAQMVDVWDAATGIGYDVTTATVKSVASHEKYIGMAMPDGTVISDVMPLLYPSRLRPYAVGAVTAAASFGLSNASAARLQASNLQSIKDTQRRNMQATQNNLDLLRRMSEQNQLRQQQTLERMRQQRSAELSSQQRANDLQRQVLEHQAQERSAEAQRRFQDQQRQNAAEQQRRANEQIARQSAFQIHTAPQFVHPVMPVAPVRAPTNPFGVRGVVSEGAGFTVSGSFGSPAYQRSILR